jgi:hypothetical protein
MSRLAFAAVEEADLAPLCGFVAIVFDREPSVVQSWFDHWWKLNPIWNQSIPRGWLLRAQDYNVIAFTANIPLPYIIAGHPAVCYATGTTGVHHDWRGMGLSKWVGRAFVEQEAPDLLLCTGSTPEANKLWQLFGMTPLPVNWPKNIVVTASHQRVLNSAARRRGVPNIIASGLGLLGRVWDRRAPRFTSCETVEQVNRFDPADNERLIECRASDASAYAFRDVSTANWLYFSTPYLRTTRLVFAARSGGQLLGFAAFKIQRSLLCLLECRCLNTDHEIASDLFSYAARHWGQLGGTHLSIWPYTIMIRAAIGRSRTTEQEPIAYLYKKNTVALIESDWERTPGDGDMSLF